MLKFRITYSSEKELQKAIEKLEAEFNVLSISKPYKGRGKSKYSNVYLDIEVKEDISEVLKETYDKIKNIYESNYNENKKIGRINVKIIDTQNKDYIFTEYQSDTVENAIEKLKRVYGLEVENFECCQNELKMYCYIDH